MTDKSQAITSKMEDLFLSILRGVILFVSAVSILAAIYFAISGVFDLGAKPKDYEVEKFDSKQLLNELNNELNPKKPAPASNTPAAPAPSAGTSPINDEITALYKIAETFMKPYNLSIDLAGFKQEQVGESKNFGIVYGGKESGQLQYLKGKKRLYEDVLLNTEYNKRLREIYDETVKMSVAEEEHSEKTRILNEFTAGLNVLYRYVNTSHSDFHLEQISKKAEFVAAQGVEVAMRHAGAMFKIFTAAGLFATFLLLSLILVLVKIERNLRSTKD